MLTLPKLLLTLGLLGLATATGAHSFAETSTPKAAAATSQHDRVAQDSTMSLLDARARYSVSAAGDRGQRLTELLAAARSRRDALAAMVETDPAEVLRVVLPAEIRAGFPAEALPLLEQDTEEEGALEVLHFDHVDPAADHYEYFLQTAKERLSLHFAGKAPPHVSGTRVRVRGVKVGTAVVLADGASTSVMTAVPTLSSTLGAQKTLAILVNFSDAPTQPYSVAYAQSMMFATTSNYDYEASYQQTSLTGAVAGWFTITETSSTCNYSAIASKAQQAAAAAGFVLLNYNRYVYVFPANSCAWWGLGSVGGNPSQAWIHAKWGFTLPVVGHEMGHNFGLYHSHSLDCGAASVAVNGCVASDYGDIFDMMGSGNDAPHFNAYQKERLGWLNAGVSPPVTTVPVVAGTTQYTIAPIEDARNTVPRALKIPRGTSCAASNEWLYVESRQAKGFDAFLASNGNVQGGVLIHKVTDGDANSSYLLDMTPETTAWSDAALMAGQAFTDPLTGLRITPLSVGSSSSTIAVSFPAAACTHNAPTLTLTPTGTVYASSGASIAYAVTVQNNDGCACATSTYDVSAVVPSGWGATTFRTAGVSPASSGSASIVVTTPSSAPAAFYPVTVTATSVAAPASIGSAGGTIAVTASGALTVSTSTDKATYTLPSKGKTIFAAITTDVSSSGAAVAGAAVRVQVSDPSGSITTLSGTTDGTGTAKVSYALKARTAKAGTYSVTSKGTMGSMSSTATTSFVAH
jgi:hypothetical protein